MSKVTSFFGRHTTMIYGLVGICVVCVFLIPYCKRLYDQIPRYNWKTTEVGHIKSEEPFGAKYLDEYLHEYWKSKVYIAEDVDSAFAKYRKPSNYLIMNPEHSDSLHIADYIAMANGGSKILFANASTSIIENLTIDVENWTEQHFSINDFLKNTDDMKHRELSIWNHGRKQLKRIKIWENMISGTMASAIEMDSISTYGDYYYCYGDIPQGTYTTLISIDDERDVAARREIGYGCITFISSYAFFSNYGVQNEDLRLGMEHVMKNTFDNSLPLVIVYSNNDEEKEESDININMIFEVLLKNPSSALFLWLLFAALILAIFINGRRRRRAEDVKRKTRNSSINFINHLATIYTDDTDYAELLRIEKRVLLYKLRKEYYFDMRTRDFTQISQFAEHIANTKGLNIDHVREMLNTLEELTDFSVQVDATSYRLCINQLEEIGRV